MGFDFSGMNMISSKSNTYTIDEAFTNISIDGMECYIKLIPLDDNKYKVVCRESDKIYHSVSVENDTLFIKRNDNREWYEHFGIYWSDMEVAVYLPEKITVNYMLKVSAAKL